MKFIHVFDESLKLILEGQNYKLLQNYKCNNLTVWVFENNNDICSYIKYSTDKKSFFLSDRLMF